MQTNPTVEQSKIIRWSESPCNQSGGKGKGLWRKGFAEHMLMFDDDERQSNILATPLVKAL